MLSHPPAWPRWARRLHRHWPAVEVGAQVDPWWRGCCFRYDRRKGATLDYVDLRRIETPPSTWGVCIDHLHDEIMYD